MNTADRKKALEKIQTTTQPCMTGITITYKGERKEFDAFLIPLEYLSYNPYNGRIGSVVKSFEKQNRPLNTDNPEDNALIEKFLWESKPDANERTLKSLLHDHQQRFGIVTSDGRIIDGNRRASILARIWHDSKIVVGKKQHTEYFKAIILPTDADKKEIIRLETTYQMAEDAKVDYAPIEKYLKASDLKELNFSNEQIASFMGVKLPDVKMYLEVLDLMNEYLDTYGYSGIYTALDKSEDSFQKLRSALKNYANGGVSKMWAYNAESDVSDLKSIAFDYIRSEFDQVDFRDIFRQPNKNNTNTSIFASEEIWNNFVENHYKIIEEVEEKSLDELIKENPSGDIKRIVKARDNEWQKNIATPLSENFNHSKDKLSNKQQGDQPVKLLQKAVDAMRAVDTSQKSFQESEVARQYLEDIKAMVKKYSDVFDQ